jgi:hypothetical protein
MPSPTKFYQFAQDIANKVHNLASDSLYCLLTNTAPNVADIHVDTTTTPCEVHATSGAVELAALSGCYTKKGNSITITSCTQSGGTCKLILVDSVFTNAGAGDTGNFRYVVLFNDTSLTTSTRGIIEWWDYASSILLHVGETFTIDFDGTNGALQIA